jgi:hypothetical protein
MMISEMDVMLSTYILRLGNIEGALSAIETLPKNPRAQLCTPCNFCKVFSPGRGILKSHLRQDKLSVSSLNQD